MATDKPTPPEGYERFEPERSDGDEPTVELEPGEVIEGVVLDLQTGEHEDGRSWYLLRVKDESRGVIRYFAKGEAKTAAREGRIEVGESIWITMDTEEESFENQDGETVEYHPTHIALPGGDS